MKLKCTDYHGNVHMVDDKLVINRLSVYGIYITDLKVLLIQDPRSLRWELPGGGVEKGETKREALSREFLEEAGVAPEGNITLLCEWEEYYFDLPAQEGWRSIRKCYKVSVISSLDTLLADGNGDDSSKAALIPIKELDKMSIAPQIRKVLKVALTIGS